MALLSVDILLGLTVAVVLFHAAPLNARRHLLLAYSVLFYATWSVGFGAVLIAGSAGVFFVGQKIAQASNERAKLQWLGLGVAALLFQLALFKYFAPLIPGWAAVAVPLGVSYYSFKLISYVVDVYWEKIPAETDVVSFLVYPLFFPQIVCGPIQRARDFLPQLKQLAPSSPENLVRGLRWILLGAFQKFVVADRLAFLVNRVFDNPHAYSSVGTVLAMYAFAFQLYMDFSGLSHVAIGMGLLFGIECPRNFDVPFAAANIQEFWRRWHMTLSSWLTDYVFTPVHMATRNWGRVGLVTAIFANMVAIGLWHGATFGFIAFGVTNAVYMTVSVLTLKVRTKFLRTHPQLAVAQRWLGPVITFHMMVVAFVFFRARSFSDAVFMLSHVVPMDLFEAMHHVPVKNAVIASLKGLGLSFDQIYLAVPAYVVSEAIVRTQRSGRLLSIATKTPRVVRWAGYYAALAAIVFFGVLDVRDFIYAKF